MRSRILLTCSLVAFLLLVLGTFPARAEVRELVDFRVDALVGLGHGPYFSHVQAWKNTGIWVEAGDMVALQAEGLAWVAPPFTADRSRGPEGYGGLYCAFWNGIEHCLAEVPYAQAALVGKIGEDLGDEFLVGSTFSGVANDSGFLYLAFNDNYYYDNSGHFIVNGSVSPGTVIDFEGMVSGDYHQFTTPPEGALLTDQLVSTFGIKFESQYAGDYQPAAVIQLGSGHATSGVNGITSVSPDGTIDQGGVLVMTLWNPENSDQQAVTDYFSIRGDLKGNTTQTARLEGYSATGELLVVDEVVDSGGETMVLLAEGIHRIVFLGSPLTREIANHGIGLDDIVFAELTPVVRIVDDFAAMCLQNADACMTFVDAIADSAVCEPTVTTVTVIKEVEVPVETIVEVEKLVEVLVEVEKIVEVEVPAEYTVAAALAFLRSQPNLVKAALREWKKEDHHSKRSKKSKKARKEKQHSKKSKGHDSDDDSDGDSHHDNRSGLGDGSNPGNGKGRDHAKNQGTANPHHRR